MYPNSHGGSSGHGGPSGHSDPPPNTYSPYGFPPPPGYPPQSSGFPAPPPGFPPSPSGFPPSPGYPPQPSGFPAPPPGFSPSPTGFPPPPGYSAQPSGFSPPPPGFSPSPPGFHPSPGYPPQPSGNPRLPLSSAYIPPGSYGNLPPGSVHAGPSTSGGLSARLRRPADIHVDGHVYGAQPKNFRHGPPDFTLLNKDKPGSASEASAEMPHPFIPTHVYTGPPVQGVDEYYKGYMATHNPRGRDYLPSTPYGPFPPKKVEEPKDGARKRSKKKQFSLPPGLHPTLIVEDPKYVHKQDVYERPNGAPEQLYSGKFDSFKEDVEESDG